MNSGVNTSAEDETLRPDPGAQAPEMGRITDGGPENLAAEGLMLDTTALTIGFARRFAEYKRADLIFEDLDRLDRIVNNRWRPVQFIFAGRPIRPMREEAYPPEDLPVRPGPTVRGPDSLR